MKQKCFNVITYRKRYAGQHSQENGSSCTHSQLLERGKEKAKKGVMGEWEVNVINDLVLDGRWSVGVVS